MWITKKNRGFRLGLMVVTMTAGLYAEKVGLFFDPTVEQHKFAAGDISAALVAKSFEVDPQPLSALNAAYANKKVVIALGSNTAATAVFTSQGGAALAALTEQAYAMRTTEQAQKSFWVFGGDINGAMYGGLQLAENIHSEGIAGTFTENVAPDFLQRGAKLNYALDKRIPTYSGFMGNTSTQHAIKNVWDMKFWEAWFDQQARNRYNIVSVWNHHPFPALVKVPGYEKANLPSIEGYFGYADPTLTHEKRVAYWRQVMTYAHNRGFQFYFFCWNVAVDYAMDQYPNLTEGTNNPATTTYLSACMKALLETYPELDGWGISAGDNMGGLSKDNRGPWTWAAYGKAAHEYALLHPERKFTVIHRGLGAGIKRLYDDWKPLTTHKNMKFEYSVKYANAHMFSTQTPRYYEPDMSDAAAAGQKTFLTLRNDDFFYTDMGDPEFVRGFLKGIPYRNVINSFYIGADIYHPTRTYWCKDKSMNGQLEIERNWYMQMLWGRIAYNKNATDESFKKLIAKKLPRLANPDVLFNAWAKASRPLPWVQELVQGAWSLDAHWYAEAISIPYREPSVRSIDEFIATSVADKSSSNLCSISASGNNSCGGSKTTYKLADEMEANAKEALQLIAGVAHGDPYVNVKITNVKLQAALTLHLANKIRAATFKVAKQAGPAKEAMGKSYCWWMNYSNLMFLNFEGNDFRTVKIADWHFGDKAVLADYNSFGAGTPDCKDEILAVSVKSPEIQNQIRIHSLTARKIQFDLPADGFAKINIYTGSGQSIFQENSYNGKAGLNEFKLPSKLGVGMYLVQVESGNASAQQKILVGSKK